MTATGVASRRAPAVERDTLGAEPRRLAGLSARDLIVRFVFGAAVSVIAGVVGLVAGLRAGGVLLAFPAILPAALTLIEAREGTSQAVADVRGAAVGALAMIGFAAAAVLLAGRTPLGVSMLIATLAWVVLALVLYTGGTWMARALGEEQYLPDIAVGEVEPVGHQLRARGLTLAAAESCTGGALAALFAAVPRASEFFRGGIVAYTEDAKRSLLRVPGDVLERHGAISEEAATAMACGVRAVLGADIGIAITGVVGSRTEGKPPGLVFVGLNDGRRDRVVRVESDGTPERMRADAMRAAIRLCGESH